MVYTVPLIIFMDDVLANISKQWNKHHVVYMSNALLPQEMLEKEFTIHFVMRSPYTSPMELMRGIKDSIEYVVFSSYSIQLLTKITRKTMGNGIFMFDVKHQEEVMLIPYHLIIASDNPMQAEECSHGRLRHNYFCHTYNVGGIIAEKKTDKGYNDIFQVCDLTL